MRCLITALAAVGLPLAALPAASVDAFLDLRLGLTTAAGLADVEANDTEGEWDNNLGIRATAIASGGLGLAGGLVYGGTIARQMKEGEIDGIDIDYTSTDLRAHVGYGVAALPALHVEGLFSIGAAFAEVETLDEEDSNVDLQYGVEVNVLYTFDNSFQLGGGLGYLITDGEYDLIDTIDIEQDEFLVTLFAGYRL